jgi:chromosome partitioning protein
MMKITVSNQRGGVGKTTTAINIASIAASLGTRTLLIDADPQGSVATVLGLNPKNCLYDFLVGGVVFEDCLAQPRKNLDVLCSNRRTAQAESVLTGMLARERVFDTLFSPVDRAYGLVVIDVSPSITQIQTCAMVYTRNILVPVSMDILSYQGAGASIETAKNLNQLLKTDIRTLAILPVMVHRRMVMTELVLEGLANLSSQQSIPLLPVIRTDASVPKAARSQQFLADYDPNCKAYLDYLEATRALDAIPSGPALLEEVHINAVHEGASA